MKTTAIRRTRILLTTAAAAGLVAAASGSPCLDYARTEFCKYLPQADFRLELKTDAALGTDAFRIREEGGALVITGGNERGCLYGVYSFLEKEGGAGFYSSWCERPPRADTKLRKGLDYSEKPAIPLRECLYKDAENNVLKAKLRLNASVSGRGAEKEIERIGGLDGRFAPGLGSCHTFFSILPPKLHFKDHPEFYSEHKGQRVANRQLCLTNPEVLRRATEFVLSRIEKYPDRRFFGVSQNDGSEGACECAACKAVDDEEGSHAGTVIRFVNAIAEEVEKKHPDKIIETLAYTYTRRPPKKARPRKNVMVCFCTIECDFSKPIPESRYEPNRLLCEDIRAWGAMTDKLYVWDYTTNFGNYLHQFPNVNALQGNIRFFLQNGCVSLFEQGPYQGTYADFSSLKLWLLSKWMWNPDLDRETLLKEFFEGFYGPAAAEMRAYLDLCHAQPRDETKNPLTLSLHPTDPVFTEEFYDRAEALVEKALSKTDPKSIYARNVAIAYASVAYSRMIRTWRNNVGRKFLLSRDPKVCNAAVRLNEWAKLVEAAVKDGAKLSEFHNKGRLIDLERSLAAKPRAPADEVRATREELKAGAAKVGVVSASIVCDPGVRYQMFAKVRVKGAKRGQPVLGFSIYDARIRKGLDCRVQVMGDDMPDGVREYVGWTHVIEDGMVLYASQVSPKNVEEFEILEVGFRRADDGVCAVGGRESFSFVQVTDTHVGEANPRLTVPHKYEGRSFVDDINALEPRPAFVALTGDLVSGAYLDEKACPDAAAHFADYRRLVADRLQVPYHQILGNNDCLAKAYRQVFPDRQLRWSFEQGGVLFVGLYGYDCLKVEMTNHAGILYGDEQLAWLEKLVAESSARTLVLFTHESLADADSHLARAQLAPVLAKFRGEAIWDICGHDHCNIDRLLRIGARDVRSIGTETPIGSCKPGIGSYRKFEVRDGLIVGSSMRRLAANGEGICWEPSPKWDSPRRSAKIEDRLAAGALKVYLVGTSAEREAFRDVKGAKFRISNYQTYGRGRIEWELPATVGGEQVGEVAVYGGCGASNFGEGVRKDGLTVFSVPSQAGKAFRFSLEQQQKGGLHVFGLALRAAPGMIPRVAD